MKSDMYFVYVLQSERDGLLYSGYSRHLKLRIKAHHDGNVRSTADRRPLHLLFYEAYCNKGDALRRERYFKTTEGKKTLKRMLRESLKK